MDEKVKRAPGRPRGGSALAAGTDPAASGDKPGQPTKRYQFDFPQRATESMERLRTQMGAASYAEVVRRTIVTMEMLYEAASAGDHLILRRKDGTEERVLLS